jgi:hypothetical protein
MQSNHSVSNSEVDGVGMSDEEELRRWEMAHGGVDRYDDGETFVDLNDAIDREIPQETSPH